MPPYCVRVAPEFNKIQELTPEEQIEMKAIKGLSQSEKPKSNDDARDSGTRTSTFEDQGTLQVSINDESFSFNVDDLTIDDLNLGGNEW